MTFNAENSVNIPQTVNVEVMSGQPQNTTQAIANDPVLEYFTKQDMGWNYTYDDTAILQEIENAYNIQTSLSKRMPFRKDLQYEITPFTPEGLLSCDLVAPTDVKPGEKLPVLVYLPGSGGSIGSDVRAELENQLGLESFRGYIICPRKGSDWQNETSVKNLVSTLDAFGQSHNIDTSRMAIAGYSNGAMGLPYVISHELFNGGSKYHFNRGAIIAGYDSVVDESQINQDMAIWVGAGDSTSIWAMENESNLLDVVDDQDYHIISNKSHNDIDLYAFSADADGNGRVDMFEYLFGNGTTKL